MTGKINVHNNWDPLEEIWLGDCWPKSFYDDLDPEVRDNFHQITECTKEIQKKFEEFGVTVRRPVIDESKRELYTVNEQSNILLKPPICPRDTHGVIGNKLFVGGDLPACYEPMYKHYDPSEVYRPDNSKNIPMVIGANTVKLGKDIIFDHIFDNHMDIRVGTLDTRKEGIFKKFKKFEEQEGAMFGKDYRLHFSTEGGHLDGCYMPVNDHLVLTTEYIDDYDTILPNWKTIGINSPSYKAETIDPARAGHFHQRTYQNKWYGNFVGLMDLAPAHFNRYIKEYCADWVGNYKETYFEVNVVPIDDKNLICIDSSGLFDDLFIELENQGITCHTVPWRTRGFWDGGIHCITLDVRRRGELTDYFPERKDTGIKTVKNRFFYDTESFFKEYDIWKSQL